MSTFYLISTALLPEIQRAMADCQRIEDAADEAWFQQCQANNMGLGATCIRTDRPRDMPIHLQALEQISLNNHGLPTRPIENGARFWLVPERTHRLLLRAYLAKLMEHEPWLDNTTLYEAIEAAPFLDLPGAHYFHDDWGYQYLVSAWDEADAAGRMHSQTPREFHWTGCQNYPFHELRLDRPMTEADYYEGAEQSDELQRLHKENAKLVHTLRYVLLLTQTENELEAHHHLKVDIPAAIEALIDLPRYVPVSMEVGENEIPF